MEQEELVGLGLAIAKANRHPDPATWADAFTRAAQGEEPYPEPDVPAEQGE